MSKRQKIEQAIGCDIETLNTDNAGMIPLTADVALSGPMTPGPIRGEAAVSQNPGATAPFIARMTLKKSVTDTDSAAILVEREGLNGVVIESACFFSLDDGLIRSGQALFDPQLLVEGAR